MIKKILDYIQNNPDSSFPDTYKGLGVSSKECRDDFNNLVKEKYLSSNRIRILKDIGTIQTVPIYRLSPKGLEFLLKLSIGEKNESKIKPSSSENKKIFISHSFNDRMIADRIINILLLPNFNLEKKDIFCTSNRETGIAIRLNWRNKIKLHIKECDIYIALITTNFKESEMCLNELGAAWVLDKIIYPLVLPPVSLSNFSNLISDLQALDISKPNNTKSFIESLHNDLKEIYNLEFRAGSIVEDNIVKFVKSLKQYLRKHPGSFKSPIKRNSKSTDNRELINKIPEMEIIIKQSKIEWPGDLDMQEHFIQNQLDALRQIQRLKNKHKSNYLLDFHVNKVRMQYPDDYVLQFNSLLRQLEPTKGLI